MHYALLFILWSNPAPLTAEPCPIPSSPPIHSITTEGLHRTLPRVVTRHIRQRTGHPFDCAVWEREKIDWENLEIFAFIDVTATATAEGLNIVYTFQELPRFFAFPAAKATDLQGWSLGPGASMLNILGRDIRLDFYIRTTVAPTPFLATEYMLYAQSHWIGALPIEWILQLTHVDSFNPILEFDERSFIFELELYHRIFSHFKLLYTADLQAISHDTSVTAFTPKAGVSHEMFLSDSDWDYVPKLGAGIAFDSREKIFNPHRGIYQEFRLCQYGGFIGGPANYLELLTDFKGYVPAFNNDILALSALGRYRPGTMGAYSFFYVGGSNTLRAYDTNSENYGQHELLSTAEYRLEFFERHPLNVWDSNVFYGLQWVFGADVAMLWHPEETTPKTLMSLYTGLHILFPGFDRLRIEVGVHNFDDGLQHLQYGLSLGLYEKTLMQRQRIR